MRCSQLICGERSERGVRFRCLESHSSSPRLWQRFGNHCRVIVQHVGKMLHITLYTLYINTHTHTRTRTHTHTHTHTDTTHTHTHTHTHTCFRSFVTVPLPHGLMVLDCGCPRLCIEEYS